MERVLACGLVGTCLCLLTPAQAWVLIQTGAPLSFGTRGDLLVRTPTGLVGYDETAGTTWRETAAVWSSAAGAPGVRIGATLAATAQRVYLFGGFDGNAFTADVWSLAAGTFTWQALPAWPSTPGPSPRVDARMVERTGPTLLLFGGATASGMPAETWTLTDFLSAFSVWSSQPAPAGLVGRVGHVLVRGPQGTVVLFGGTNGTLLGDTWIYGQNWVRHLGASPPATADARAAYDPVREMTVLLHPNGDTYEWNGFAWRRVGNVVAPVAAQAALIARGGTAGGIDAFLGDATALRDYAYLPSLARIEMTFTEACVADANLPGLKLGAVDRDLPTLGDSLQLRSVGVTTNSLFLGALEPSGGVPYGPIGCECTLALTGIGTVLDYVPGVGNQRDWLLAIPAAAALDGVMIDVQGVVVDPAAPCLVMTTTRSTLTLGW